MIGGIAERLASIRDRMAVACARAGRDPASVQLVAVSKTRSTTEIQDAWEAGQRDFGENRVQEALAKSAELPSGPRFHLVGHLQKNKVRDALGVFHMIHSIDDLDLLERIERLAAAPIDVLVQVKLADEPTKSGASAPVAEKLVAAARRCERVRVVGLMTLPPPSPDPRESRRWFRELRELRDLLGGVAALPHLSMGMSHDFEVAIEEGATLIRVGEAIFGPRGRG